MNHEREDSHLGGTSLVKLNSTLVQLGLFIEGVPAEVDGVVTEITDEFSSSDVLHHAKLEESDEGDQLSNSSGRDGIDGGESVRDGCKAGAMVVNVSWESDSGFGNEVADNGKHGDTSVLELDVSETVELRLVTIGNEAERIEETKRGLGSKFTIKRVNGSDLGGSLGWRKGGGGCEEGCNDNTLHCECL